MKEYSVIKRDRLQRYLYDLKVLYTLKEMTSLFAIASHNFNVRIEIDANTLNALNAKLSPKHFPIRLRVCEIYNCTKSFSIGC